MSDILNSHDLTVDSEEQVYEALLTSIRHHEESGEKLIF